MEEYVGQLWDRFITRAARREYPHAAVTLAEVERAAGVLFRALGGDGGLRLATASATAHGARRRWRERLAGSGERAEFAWRDERALYLPAHIAVFAERTLNRDLYLWLAALAAVDAGTEQDWFTRSQRSVRQLLDRYPGMRARYRRLVAAQLALRPAPETLPADEAAQERALRAALNSPGSVAQLPTARRAPAPVWLWLHPRPPRTAATVAPDAEDSAAASGARHAQDRRRRAAERSTSPDGRSGLLLYRFEGIFGIGEFARVNRGTEDGDADHARADDFDKLSIARDAQTVASRVRFDLDLPSAGDDDVPLGPGRLLPEWDYRRQVLRPDHCRIQPLVAAHAVPCALPDVLRNTARRLRHQFEALRPARVWRNGQPDGSEPDLDAWLRHASERAAGQVTATPSLYRRRDCGRRDLACLLLADLSLSTDSWIGNERRVIDVIRDSLWLFSEALTATGDRFALHGFSSRKRELVRFHHLKGFDEAYSPLVRGRIQAIKPGYYTRLGAAIRQATALLTREPAAQRLLLVLTDGKPNDLDLYEGRYGIEDTRHAVLAARRAGLTPFCVTIDDDAADYLPHLFGAGSYVMIRRPEQLPRLLPQLYARLTSIQ
jgi:nitric oxide reductase NorD protein